MKVESAVKSFLLACEADGLRPATLRWYEYIVGSFADHFKGIEMSAVTTDMMRRYIVTLRQRDNRYGAQRPKTEGGLTEDSIAAHIRALKRFWKWSANEYQLANNPMNNIRRPPRRSPAPKAVSMVDVKALFAATAQNVMGARDRAILAFLIDTGCRAQGVVELTLERLEISKCRAFVIEKGSKRRAVFFTPYTAELITAWLTCRPVTNANTVFYSVSNKHYGLPLTTQGLFQILKRLKRKAGVKGQVNPHSFRHAFAREYIKEGGDLSTLSRLMGHSDSLVTSWYYAVFSSEELAEAHRKYSPANHLKTD
jgi:integrase/recombinase XerD